MGRPKKCRKVCQLPNTKEFLPVGTDDCTTAIVLTVDEFETLRLIDLQDLSQEECGANMQVARTTVQSIYGSARKKLAQALVEGRPIRIEGGDYQLCDGSGGRLRLQRLSQAPSPLSAGSIDHRHPSL